MKLLVDEYEIFLDASHFRIPLIWCNVCIPVQSSSKKDPRSFKFLVFLFKFAGFRWIFSGQVPSHAKRQEILWWIVGGGQGGRVAVTVRYQLHQQDQTRAFSLKPLPLHPFGTLKRRRQKGWWVETFFFWNIDSRKWQVWWPWKNLKKLRNLQHEHPVLVENFAKSLKAEGTFLRFCPPGCVVLGQLATWKLSLMLICHQASTLFSLGYGEDDGPKDLRPIGSVDEWSCLGCRPDVILGAGCHAECTYWSRPFCQGRVVSAFMCYACLHVSLNVSVTGHMKRHPETIRAGCWHVGSGWVFSVSPYTCPCVFMRRF